MTATGTSSWHVVQTHGHSETKAAAHLLRQGYMVYLPRYLKRRRHARRIETVAAALFPRYLFVSPGNLTQGVRAIQSTIGVTQLVRNGDRPALVSSDVIAKLRAREDANGFIKLDARPRFGIGDKIRVIEGAFDSCLGLFEGMADRDRVAILLDLLGRKVRVLLNEDSIAIA